MTDKELQLITGALLHDIGKVIYRTGDSRKHSVLGYEYLKNEAGIQDKEVLDAVRYHHGDALAHVDIARDALAYIVYIADNIAAASDRRKADNEEKGFDAHIPLQSIFNILNGNNQNHHYHPMVMEEMAAVNMPTDTEIPFDQSFYHRVQTDLLDTLKGIEHMNDGYVHSLLSAMEAYLNYIPSSTAKDELADISLYDHVKMTAAYSSCIYQYLSEKNIVDYRIELFEQAKEFYEKKAFRLFSMDISGIQKFIYTIHSSGALKMLRSRSFYLEITMEHMIDEILEQMHLSRANLIYSGGGHCYILLPNTKEACEKLENLQNGFTDWFVQNYGISLYAAMCSVECSAYELENNPSGSYREIFKKLGEGISAKKMNRYTGQQIRFLNQRKREDATRECKVCKNIGKVNSEGHCPLCTALSAFSNDILYKNFFTVYLEEKAGGLLLPNGKWLVAQNEEELKKSMESDPYFVRTYGKNKFYTGKYVATKLWVGDYTCNGKTTEEYAKEAEGIDRIAVLRADVDNLGRAFVSGFEDKYTTLSRTATFSRQLSLFFKHYINRILKDGTFQISRTNKARKATIVYSGGDDLFVVGSWNDIIAFAVDIYQDLRKYSMGMLSISAGIGIYPAKYPLSVAASEVALLEERSKAYPDEKNPRKNAITIFEETYPWESFIQKVIGEKLEVLQNFFAASDERGEAFLYRLLDLIRERKEKINLARFAYVLARLEPTGDVKEKQKVNYGTFAKRMYEWMQDAEDSRQLVTAIYIYVYTQRRVKK